MSFEISGLDDLQRTLEDAQRALRSLDGEVAKIEFDPDDPASVEKAIRQVEAAIDRKLAPYGANAIVAQVAEQAKEQYRAEILKQANKRS